MRKFISIVEALNEATPVRPAQPVKPMKPGDQRNNSQNTTAPTNNQQNPQNTQQQQQPQSMDHKLPNGQPQVPLPNGQRQQAPGSQQGTQQAPLPNGQQEQPQQANGQLQMGQDGKPLDPRDPNYNPELEGEQDENGDPIDPKMKDGLNAGEQAQAYLKKQGFKESVEEEKDHLVDALSFQNGMYPNSKNGASYKGHPCYIGAIDIHSGKILELHNQGRVKAYNYDLFNAIFGSSTVDLLRAEDAAVFWMEPDGRCMIDFEHGEGSGGPFLRRKLERMIRSQLD